ncbi:MAG: hypothetical protein J7L15_07445 [Clostridiales bacterium]|nr:hypothetical protein [Clostridiales bacterium]
MQTIIGVSGKKQSGKNTLCDCVEKYFAEQNIDEDIVTISFADALKEKVCIGVLGLTHEQCYGSDEDKNTLTTYTWENIPHKIRYDNRLSTEYASNGEICEHILPKGTMTAREIMQVVGTDIFRQYFNDNLWVNATLRQIEKTDAKVILISDVRFPSEVMSLINRNFYVIRLLRDVCEKDSHSSETALDNFDFNRKNCIIFDNREMNIEEQNKETFSILSDILKLKDKVS